MKKILTALGTVTCLALLTVPAIAAQQTTSPAQTSTAGDNAKTAWPPESLHGTVWTVDIAHKKLTVKDNTGVPFDFTVEPSTTIKSGQKDLTFGDLLSADKVTVTFKPEAKGDIAEKIQVGG